MISYWEAGATPRERVRGVPEGYLASEVEYYIVPGWNESEEARAVIAFMKAGETVYRLRGFAGDRIDGEMLGTTCMAQGKWQYPEKWWRYIEKHSVRPPSEAFIADALAWYQSTRPE